MHLIQKPQFFTIAAVSDGVQGLFEYGRLDVMIPHIPALFKALQGKHADLLSCGDLWLLSEVVVLLGALKFSYSR